MLQAGLFLRHIPITLLLLPPQSGLEWALSSSWGVCGAEPGKCSVLSVPEVGARLGQLCCSQPVSLVWIAMGWLLEVCAVGEQGTPPPVQSVSSSGHGSLWAVLLKCWGDWCTEEMLAGFSCTTGVSYSDSLDNIQVLSLLFFCIPACSCLPCVGPTCISIILSLELDALIQSSALIAVLQSDLNFYFILVDNPLSMWSHWRFKFYSFPKCVLRSSEVLLTIKLVLVIQTYIPMVFFFLSATFPSGCLGLVEDCDPV